MKRGSFCLVGKHSQPVGLSRMPSDPTPGSFKFHRSLFNSARAVLNRTPSVRGACPFKLNDLCTLTCQTGRFIYMYGWISAMHIEVLQGLVHYFFSLDFKIKALFTS
ncbi:hypothetical protein ILYODFUR_036384 [Ilyodon furcidens]|uniref:Uncharacterized protein n=1 Tax=Ilyodon furcidens TaxID=33524 RepID=A0ABV0UBA9_9TELE